MYLLTRGPSWHMKCESWDKQILLKNIIKLIQELEHDILVKIINLREREREEGRKNAKLTLQIRHIRQNQTWLAN